MARTILLATAIAGTLDILSAFVFAAIVGIGPVTVLRTVASGPLGDVALGAPASVLIGLAVHFAIMACMVAAYMFAAERVSALRRWPVIAGIVYGLLLWFVMYWIVQPLRWGLPFPSNPVGIAKQLFSHIVLVGVPVALIAARGVRRRPSRPPPRSA